jgi:serine/threonine-protein kinase ATR
MADPQLCDQTFSVWSALLAVLDEEDLELVIPQTFALIAQNWACFSEETINKANETLQSLIKKHNGLLREKIDYIPSLASIPMFSKFEGEIQRLKGMVDKAKLFGTFNQRLNDENAVVVRHALKELVPFLEENQKILHEAAISEKPFPVLPELTRSLLDASVKFSEDSEDIPIFCAKCLGMVGGLDPYKVETVREKKHILVLSNFERLDEVVDFCAFLLEHVLVKVFHSTTNARAQGFLAYVMQELLRACGFNTLTVQRPRASQPSPALRRWTEIPETVRNTLTPFLNSRYLIRGIPKRAEQVYPIFAPGISHSSWLRAFVYDLLQKGQGENARMIFTALARIIKGHDLSIATFILPFAVLNLIITGEESDTSKIGLELLTVLQSEIQPGDQTEALKIKQCSEVSLKRSLTTGKRLTGNRMYSKLLITSLYGFRKSEQPSPTREQWLARPAGAYRKWTKSKTLPPSAVWKGSCNSYLPRLYPGVLLSAALTRERSTTGSSTFGKSGPRLKGREVTLRKMT